MEIDYEQRNKDLQELINRDWQDKVGLTIAKLNGIKRGKGCSNHLNPQNNKQTN